MVLLGTAACFLPLASPPFPQAQPIPQPPSPLRPPPWGPPANSPNQPGRGLGAVSAPFYTGFGEYFMWQQAGPKASSQVTLCARPECATSFPCVWGCYNTLQIQLYPRNEQDIAQGPAASPCLLVSENCPKFLPRKPSRTPPSRLIPSSPHLACCPPALPGSAGCQKASENRQIICSSLLSDTGAQWAVAAVGERQPGRQAGRQPLCCCSRPGGCRQGRDGRGGSSGSSMMATLFCVTLLTSNSLVVVDTRRVDASFAFT